MAKDVELCDGTGFSVGRDAVLGGKPPGKQECPICGQSVGTYEARYAVHGWAIAAHLPPPKPTA